MKKKERNVSLMYVLKVGDFMGRILAITNQKGGVGKTTTSVNLSACLAQIGKKTLLVDIDPQGNATSGIGIDKSDVDQCVYDVLVEDVEAKQVIKETKIENLTCDSSYDSISRC